MTRLGHRLLSDGTLTTWIARFVTSFALASISATGASNANRSTGLEAVLAIQRPLTWFLRIAAASSFEHHLIYRD